MHGQNHIKFCILLPNRSSWSATTSKSNSNSSLWSTFSAPDQNKLLTFHVPIFPHPCFIIIYLLLRLHWEICNHGFFYLDGGLACHKTFNLKGQIFNHGLLPYMTCFHHNFQFHLLLVWFWSVFLLEGLQPSSYPIWQTLMIGSW